MKKSLLECPLWDCLDDDSRRTLLEIAPKGWKPPKDKPTETPYVDYDFKNEMEKPPEHQRRIK